MKTVGIVIGIIFLMAISFIAGKFAESFQASPKIVNNLSVNTAQLEKIANEQEKKMRIMDQHKKERAIIKEISESMDRVLEILKNDNIHNMDIP